MAKIKKLSPNESKLSIRDSFYLRKIEGLNSPSYQVIVVATPTMTTAIIRIDLQIEQLDIFPRFDEQTPYIGYIEGIPDLKKIRARLLRAARSEQDKESIREVFTYAIQEDDSSGQIVAFYEHFKRVNKNPRRPRKKSTRKPKSILKKIRAL